VGREAEIETGRQTDRTLQTGRDGTHLLLLGLHFSGNLLLLELHFSGNQASMGCQFLCQQTNIHDRQTDRDSRVKRPWPVANKIQKQTGNNVSNTI
jgi:hypothetical protein